MLEKDTDQANREQTMIARIDVLERYPKPPTEKEIAWARL